MVSLSKNDQCNVEHENSSKALSVLRGMLDGLTPRDARLPAERELAIQLGVGRRAVRRALEVLEAEGLIWRKQGKGTFIGSQPIMANCNPGMANCAVTALLDRTSPEEVCEARLHLEPRLAAMAALRASPEQVRRMRELCDRISSADDDDARELWDEALHRLIGQAAGNTLLFGFCEIFEEVRRDEAWRTLRERARSASLLTNYSDQHHAIVAAIAERDADAAATAMRLHIETLTDNIMAQYNKEIPRVG